MVDVNRGYLKYFYTRDRPLVWRYLNVTLKRHGLRKKKFCITVPK